MITPKQAAKTLNQHHEKFGAGFYLSSKSFSGRAFAARVHGGALQITDDFSVWFTVDTDATFWAQSGRPIGNMPHQA